MSIEGQNLNYKLISRGVFSSSNENANIKALAWITDTSENSIWTQKYKDAGEVGVAEYAVGSPSLELYLASYNATNATQLWASGGSSGYGSYGDGTSIHGASTGVMGAYHGIYSLDYFNGGNWWLASPYNNSYEFWEKSQRQLWGRDDVRNTGIAVRPVVCIPTATFNSTLLNGLTDE